ncbi:MAG: DinB family protein [Planctomycetes bacterium]|nr:DinB family protein [Planctomycetota bacterium]MBI3834485.1 DinB family protein [Planctomycetota bacterium]
MTKWPWIERTFTFDFPASKWPDLLERVRGTPARIEERVRTLPEVMLTPRHNDQGWSIKENIGHLLDLGYLPKRRIEQILAGESALIAADMSNQATHKANHNATPISKLLNDFRSDRAELVAMFERLNESDWEKSAIHPRLKSPMRIVDIAYFDAEHDDYHLGRIGQLIRMFSR